MFRNPSILRYHSSSVFGILNLLFIDSSHLFNLFCISASPPHDIIRDMSIFGKLSLFIILWSLFTIASYLFIFVFYPFPESDAIFFSLVLLWLVGITLLYRIVLKPQKKNASKRSLGNVLDRILRSS